MRFSIIIPIYNTENYLDRCIQSVLNQTMSDYEVILIDDCSSDSSLKIAQSYESAHVRILKNEMNSGLSVTRNNGIRNASGDYILFLDSDDYINSSALFDLNVLICQNAFPDIIYTGFIEERGHCKTKKFGYASEHDKLYSRYDFLKSELEKRTLYAAACFGVYKRNFIVDNRLFFKAGIYHEDELWTPQVVYRADNIYLSNLAYYHYIRRDDSITKAKDKTQNGIDLIKSCKELAGIFNDMDDIYLEKLMNNHIAMLYMKAMCRGRLYRKEYIGIIDRMFPVRNAFMLKDRMKAILFLISPYCYYLLDKRYGDNEV